MKFITVAALILSYTLTVSGEADAAAKKRVCPCVTITKTAKPTADNCACPLIFCEPTPSSERCHTTVTSWIPQANPYCSTATTTFTPCDCPNLSYCGCITSTKTKTAPTTCISCYTATETVKPIYSCSEGRACPKIACLPTTSTVTVPKPTPWCPSPSPTEYIYGESVCPKPCCADRETIYETVTKR